MTDSPTALTALTSDVAWVRRLARTLATDAHEADDLAQEACLVALRHPPAHGDNLRAWFRRVLQNLARQRHRSAARRCDREHQVASAAPFAAAASDQLVERAATHRAVVDAVLLLDETYRTVILLRFFEDLPPRAIAQRLAVPVATVHTRLQRACERLRQRLDAQHGSRRGWCAALLPLPAFGTAIPSLGLFAMNSKSIAITASVAFGAAALWFGTGLLSTPTAPVQSGQHGAEVVRADVPRTPAAPTTAPVREAVPPAASPSSLPASAPAADPGLIRGRVVDAEGAGASGLQVALLTPASAAPRTAGHARSDHTGTFVLTAATTRGRLVVDEPGWRTVLHAVVDRGAGSHPALVVAAPALALAGTVRRDDGRPVAGARVQVLWPDELRTRIRDIGDTAAEEIPQVLSAADGTFTLDAARVRGGWISTTAEGLLPDRRELPAADERALAITLRAPTARPGMVQGQVVDPRGRPIAGAHVALGRKFERSGDDGGFLIEDDGNGPTLAAVSAGHRRGTVAREGGFAPFVVVALGGEPLAIHGRVVDEQGRGVPDIKVWANDLTLLADTRDPVACEGITLGCTTLHELRDRFQRGEFRDPAEALRNTPTTGWPWVRTAADGTFTLPGLEDRAYTLRAMDEISVQIAERADVAAGSTGIAIELRRDELFARVAGQVVTAGGDPVPGVTVMVQADPMRLGGATTHGRAKATAVADAEGRFELRNVPKTRAYLRLEGERILPLEYGRRQAGLLEPSGGDVEHLRIAVGVRVHVQVELQDPTSADEIAVLDRDDEAIVINVFSGRGRRETDTLQLAEGRSPVFVVPDTAATLVLKKSGQDVQRHALQLRLDVKNDLRF